MDIYYPKDNAVSHGKVRRRLRGPLALMELCGVVRQSASEGRGCAHAYAHTVGGRQAAAID